MSLLVVHSVAEVRQQLNLIRRQHRSIGLVPTMGALHAAHGRLVEIARSECDYVVVSIFVNPLQFGPAEDYARYPRSLEKDVALCEKQGADLIFAPETQDMYSSPQCTFVEVTRVSDHLCGKYRPGHFRGVATVVLKLFNIIQPERAYFGEKDYQQLAVIRRMVEDVNLPITIVAVPTVRENDGLAMSSRNVFLDAAQRQSAAVLFRALEAARAMIESGESDSAKVKAEAIRIISSEKQISPEYLEIVETAEVQPEAVISQPVRVAAAIRIGNTRLIDNVEAVPRR